MTNANITKFIVACITFLGVVSALVGGALVWKGYEGGTLIAGGAGSAISGLIGFLGGKMQGTPAGTIADPVATTTTNTSANPVPVTETLK
jgi:hypothetical protein